MAAEDDSDTTSPASNLADISPFLTPEEGKKLDHEILLIEERRVKVANHYHLFRSVRKVADELKVGKSTVQRDLDVIRQGYRRLTLRSYATHVSEAIEELDSFIRMLKEDYQRTHLTRPNTNLASLILAANDRRNKILGLYKQTITAANDAAKIKVVSGIDLEKV
jgi:hypothetical protein